MSPLRKAVTAILVLNVFVTAFLASQLYMANWIIKQQLPRALELSYLTGYLHGAGLPIEKDKLLTRLPVTQADEKCLEFILHPGSGTRARLHFSKDGKCHATLWQE